MTWKQWKQVETESITGDYFVFEQHIDGVIARTLSLQGFVEYTNELEQAILIAVANPKLINVLHNAVNKA